MFRETLPQGPTPAVPLKSSPDRTRILDEKRYWPDERACPNWPHLPGNMRYDGMTGKAGAEQRLSVIGQILNQAATSLHIPSSDEVIAEFSRVFRRSGTFYNWPAIGILDLSPLGMMAEKDAMLMVEACHIRGYLRKLEAAAKRDEESAKERKQSEARRALEEYRSTVPSYVEELSGLADAVARHQQRLDDEKAVQRTQMLRQHAETLHSSAVQAAHTLGLSVPEAPEF
ncbi:hypothetical protein [Novosphingobium sp. Leaf2]|uniref:hypothetical protein n=1 Tax=Novosphingobium sp. Leaf2 TaxID=1735670 RepID=UPI0006FFB967|nr:hypothetical protein [Novosphingobium sp. Leaf2]KQM13835.1 hypothetical protein ASE49_12340 [Novosphingobium sp. Leaf2]